jgi:hypothetical protein
MRSARSRNPLGTVPARLRLRPRGSSASRREPGVQRPATGFVARSMARRQRSTRTRARASPGSHWSKDGWVPYVRCRPSRDPPRLPSKRRQISMAPSRHITRQKSRPIEGRGGRRVRWACAGSSHSPAPNPQLSDDAGQALRLILWIMSAMRSLSCVPRFLSPLPIRTRSVAV